MARKLASRSYLFARLGSTRLFWRVRYGFDWVNFRRLRTSFQIKDSVNNTSTELRYWRELSKGTVKPIILAVVVSLAIYFFERNLSFFTSIGWIHDNIIGQYLLHKLSNETYVQMLTVIAGVTGVFLGLYFTAVSTIIFNIYSYGNVRDLIVNDRFSNIYVRSVAFLTALSVVLLALSSTNIAPLHLAISLLAIMSCFAVFAFLKLGMRAFFLTDPTQFLDTVTGELQKWVNQATYRGYQWHNQSFQEHYRKRALKSANVITTLIEMSSRKADLQDKSYPMLLTKLLFQVGVYYEKKRLIPSESRWYDKKFQHRQWYLTDSTAVEMATQTDTTLQPNEIPDTTWLEDIILAEVFKAFGADAETGNYQALYSKISNLPDYFKGIGANWLAEDGEKWHAKLSKDILVRLSSTQNIDEAQEVYSIAVTDILASLPMSLELGFMKALNELDVSKLFNQLVNAKYYDKTTPYRFVLPPNAIKALEQAHSSVVFEQEALAPHKTPNWYIADLVFHELDLTVYDQWQLLMKMMETWYAETGKALSDAKKYKQSVSIYSRAIELAWKLDSHIERIKELSEALQKDGRVDFLKKTKWDWNAEHKRVTEFRDLAIKGQAGLIPYLFNTKEPDPSMPDFFGGIVHQTGEACYEALANGNTEKFKVLFRPYFFGILGIFDSIRPKVISWETSSALAWMSEPLLDLFDVSGYAYIYAEYYNKP